MTTWEMIAERFGGRFWTRFAEMIEEFECCGFQILYADRERVEIGDERDDEEEITLWLAGTESTIWIREICTK